MKAEERFFLKKLEFDYGDDRAKKELKKIAGEVEWLKGWPKDKAAFWNGEAFMWRNKISKGKRELIGKELRGLSKGKNLDLGCGAYSYVDSVGMDISERMLRLNERLKERWVGDLEEELGFKAGEFDSVSLVLVLDYVKNYDLLLGEVFRVLKDGGKLVVVQSKEKVNEWQRQKVVKEQGFSEWRKVLKGKGFKVKFYEKEGLGFFRCQK